MSIAKTVNLHGGPMHGQQIALAVGDNHFHVQGFPSTVNQIRTGMYSSAHGSITDFEWDGWRDHD